jgi:hypothetical protein
LELGNTGTEQDFINSLKGESSYEAWINAGNEGTEEEFVESMKIMGWSKF